MRVSQHAAETERNAHRTSLLVRHRRGGLWIGVAGLAVVALGAAAAGSALASSPSGAVTETINVGVRSLTVSPTSVSMCSTANPLTFPNGICIYPPAVTITNGPAGGHIDVTGADAAPSDQAGNAWALCVPSTSCSGTAVGIGRLPGQDQYYDLTVGINANGAGTQGSYLTSGTPQCDRAFDLPGSSGCSSSPGQTATEGFELHGPSTSSDQSPTFTTSVTWTAAP